MMDPDELAHRFAYHPPATSDTVAAHETVRRETGDLSALLNELLPDSREKALAMTRLEEVMMWSNVAIARGSARPTSGAEQVSTDG
jgi:hypothetical protein